MRTEVTEMERSSTLARKTQHKVKNGLRLAVTYLFLGLLGLVMVYPLLWMVASSFKESKGIFNSISIIPPSLSLEHYIEGWKGVGEYTFTTFFTNTFSIVIPSTVFIIVSCLLVAYGFARFEFPMKKFLFTAMMATLMLPSAVIIIPRYMLFKQFGWLDTYLPFIVPAMFAGNSFFIFQLVQFFRGIPRELDEAASIYISSVKKYPLSLALRMTLDLGSAAAWNEIFAMSVLSILPPVLLFFAGQKYFIQGISTSGLKG